MLGINLLSLIRQHCGVAAFTIDSFQILVSKKCVQKQNGTRHTDCDTVQTGFTGMLPNYRPVRPYEQHSQQ